MTHDQLRAIRARAGMLQSTQADTIALANELTRLRGWLRHLANNAHSSRGDGWEADRALAGDYAPRSNWVRRDMPDPMGDDEAQEATCTVESDTF
jgi:hypothetical protein